MGDVVKKRVVMDFCDWVYGARWERLDECAPDGLVLLSEGDAEHLPGIGRVIIPATYGTLAQVATNVGATFIPAVEK